MLIISCHQGFRLALLVALLLVFGHITHCHELRTLAADHFEVQHCSPKTTADFDRSRFSRTSGSSIDSFCMAGDGACFSLNLAVFLVGGRSSNALLRVAREPVDVRVDADGDDKKMKKTSVHNRI